jgi:hypothetical protein
LSASIRAPGLVAGDFGVEAARVTGAQPIVAAELMRGSPCPVAVVPSNVARAGRCVRSEPRTSTATRRATDDAVSGRPPDALVERGRRPNWTGMGTAP